MRVLYVARLKENIEEGLRTARMLKNVLDVLGVEFPGFVVSMENAEINLGIVNSMLADGVTEIGCTQKTR